MKLLKEFINKIFVDKIAKFIFLSLLLGIYYIYHFPSNIKKCLIKQDEKKEKSMRELIDIVSKKKTTTNKKLFKIF